MAVSGFRLRARLDCSIPSARVGPRGITPLLDTALLIRALERLEPSRSGRCPAHTMAGSDFSRSYINGDSSSPSRCGPRSWLRHWPDARPPGSRAKSVRTCQVSDHAGPSGHSRSRARPCCLPRSETRRHRDLTSFAAQWLACALPCRRFAATLAGANARLGAEVVSLRLPRGGLAPPTPCRSPGALRLSSSYYTW